LWIIEADRISVKNIANDPDPTHVSNLVVEHPTVSTTLPDRVFEINDLPDSFQYLKSITASSIPDGEIALCTAWGNSVDDYHLAGVDRKESTSERNIKPEHNDKPNMHAEDSDYIDPNDNTGSWIESDSNGFESSEYLVLQDAMASDPDLFARSLPLFQAEWQRKNIPRSPGVISCATTGDSTSETGAISSEVNEASQKKPGSHLDKHTLPGRDPDGGDETDDEPRRKRQKQTRDSNKPYDGPRFACPFYKKDPAKYCPSATTGNYSGDKFAQCHKYGSIELHRLVR
jgi:hypothetical protein